MARDSSGDPPGSDKLRQYDGPCSLVWCREAGPHSHEVCQACGATEHGNLFCTECKEFWRSLNAGPVVKVFDDCHQAFYEVGEWCMEYEKKHAL